MLLGLKIAKLIKNTKKEDWEVEYRNNGDVKYCCATACLQIRTFDCGTSVCIDVPIYVSLPFTISGYIIKRALYNKLLEE